MKKRYRYLVFLISILSTAASCYGQDSTRRVDSVTAFPKFLRSYFDSKIYNILKNRSWITTVVDNEISSGIYLSNGGSLELMRNGKMLSYSFSRLEGDKVVFFGENRKKFEELSIQLLTDSTSLIEVAPLSNAAGDRLSGHLKNETPFSVVMYKTASCCKNNDHKTKHCASDWNEMIKYTRTNKCLF